MVRLEGGHAHVEKCEELDEKIEHYRSLMARVTDRQTNEGIGKLIETCRLKKRCYTLSAKPTSAAEIKAALLRRLQSR